MTQDQFLAPKDAAEILGCSGTWVRALADRGDLEMAVTPLGRLITAKSVEAYIGRKNMQERFNSRAAALGMKTNRFGELVPGGLRNTFTQKSEGGPVPAGNQPEGEIITIEGTMPDGTIVSFRVRRVLTVSGEYAYLMVG